MRWPVSITLFVALAGTVALAQSPAASTRPAPGPATTGPATRPADGRLDFGAEGLTFPPIVIVNKHRPRTAELLGEAYRRREPLVWKRVQYVTDLGQVALPAGAP